MPESLSVRDLDNIAFQRREWTIERVGWSLMAAILVAAVLGVFGAGPVSTATARDPGAAVAVEYERFVRQTGVEAVTITVGSTAVAGGGATVFISAGLIGSWQIQDVTPPPDSATRTSNGVTYEFSAAADSAPVIIVSYRPQALGLSRGTIRAGDSGGVTLWQLAYP